MLIYPAAFNMTTGPLHWSLLQRSRANDNQLYVACVSPARAAESGYIAWGHTQLTTPWGTVLRELEENEDMIIEDIGENKKLKTRIYFSILKLIEFFIYLYIYIFSFEESNIYFEILV